MIFCIIFDFSMAGDYVFIWNRVLSIRRKAARFLTGYNMKSEDERKKYDENVMCKAYGKRMIFMSFRFSRG